MRLYRHSAQCPIALRSFLDCNPNYWCFVPMLWYDTQTEDIFYSRSGTIASSSTTDPEQINVILMGAIDNQRVARYMDHVPIPPSLYSFSKKQRQQQRLFFEKFVFSSITQQPYSTLDLYKMAIIAVCK
jgi:hypothetical protein